MRYTSFAVLPPHVVIVGEESGLFPDKYYIELIKVGLVALQVVVLLEVIAYSCGDHQ